MADRYSRFATAQRAHLAACPCPGVAPSGPRTATARSAIAAIPPPVDRHHVGFGNARRHCAGHEQYSGCRCAGHVPDRHAPAGPRRGTRRPRERRTPGARRERGRAAVHVQGGDRRVRCNRDDRAEADPPIHTSSVRSGTTPWPHPAGLGSRCGSTGTCTQPTCSPRTETSVAWSTSATCALAIRPSTWPPAGYSFPITKQSNTSERPARWLRTRRPGVEPGAGPSGGQPSWGPPALASLQRLTESVADPRG